MYIHLTLLGDFQIVYGDRVKDYYMFMEYGVKLFSKNPLVV